MTYERTKYAAQNKPVAPEDAPERVEAPQSMRNGVPVRTWHYSRLDLETLGNRELVAQLRSVGFVSGVPIGSENDGIGGITYRQELPSVPVAVDANGLVETRGL
jgi:hypothetical protein